MALFNYATKEITLKIVYYGPGLSGKTTNLQYLHAVLNPDKKGKLLSLSTESERTLFFDFLPIELGKIRDFSIRFQLYTVPGQVRYNATRKVVLKGADAVVFVADSQEEMREQNIESLENMRENLISNNINPDTIPIMLQYNKRDLINILSSELLNKDLNKNGTCEVLEAVAIDGRGVEETFKKITRLLLKDISRRHKIEIQFPEEVSPVAPPAEPSPRIQPEPPRERLNLHKAFDNILDKTAQPIPDTVKLSEFETSLSLKEISKKYRTEIPLPEEARPVAPPAGSSPQIQPEPPRERLNLHTAFDNILDKAAQPIPDMVKLSEFETSLSLKEISKKYRTEIPLPEEVRPAAAPVEPAQKAPPEPVREEVSADKKADKTGLPLSEPVKISEFETSLLLKEISRKYKSEIPLPEEVRPAAAPAEPAPKAPLEPVREETSLDSILDKIHHLMSETEEIEAEFESVVLAPQETEPEDALDHVPGLTDEIVDANPAEPIAVIMQEPGAVAAAPEIVEDVIFPEAVKRIEEEEPTFPETPAAELPADIEGVSREPFPAEKIDEFSERIRDLSEKVGSISDAVSLLRQTVSDMKEEVNALKSEITLSGDRTAQGLEFKDSQEFGELKREQKKISELVMDIVDVLHTLKEKKSWFRL